MQPWPLNHFVTISLVLAARFGAASNCLLAPTTIGVDGHLATSRLALINFLAAAAVANRIGARQFVDNLPVRLGAAGA